MFSGFIDLFLLFCMALVRGKLFFIKLQRQGVVYEFRSK